MTLFSLFLVACESEPRWILRTDVLTPGADCAEGGLAIVGGEDVDGNDELSNAEVQTREVICAGATGSDGGTALVSTSEEPPGDNCAEGGTRVDSGIDDDADGVLDAGEIDATEYVCQGSSPEAPRVWYGDAMISAASDLELLEGYVEVTGDLFLSTATDVALPDLRVVGGGLYVSDADTSDAVIPTVDVPSFERTDTVEVNGVRLEAPALSMALSVGLSGSVPAVDFLDGITTLDTLYANSVTIDDAAGLSTLEALDYLSVSGSSLTLPALTVADEVYMNAGVVEAPELTTVSTVSLYSVVEPPGFLSGVSTLDTLYINGASFAEGTRIDALSDVGSLQVYYGTVPDFPALRSVEQLNLYYTNVTDLDGFSAVRSISSLYLTYNLYLTDIDGIRNARATTSNYAYLYYNWQLCDSTADTLLRDMGFTSWYLYNASAQYYGSSC
jgi:hypothetical protein